MRPSILILHASGTNRDTEAARACELAGGAPEIVHINQLRRGERRFADYQMLLLPGGFSYGDALGAGARLALDLQVYFHDQLHAFAGSGKPVLGICNGFQTLVKAGILNYELRITNYELRDAQHATRDTQQEILGTEYAIRSTQLTPRRLTLTENASGHFECRWVHLSVNRQARASFLNDLDELIFCPIAHGEGNFQVANGDVLAELEAEHLVAFRYVDASGAPANGQYPLNPNGSVADIAGICNEAGNVLGLMPHPEDHILPIQTPVRGNRHLGLPLFRAVINACQ
ncbi:MAG: phosphoribosylformylglycinamidine synthase I [Anaerolineales bacterium]|nr:phosphoribosylformylglycinamidine synthase I [Anaerolineales bacterium]